MKSRSIETTDSDLHFFYRTSLFSFFLHVSSKKEQKVLISKVLTNNLKYYMWAFLFPSFYLDINLVVIQKQKRTICSLTVDSSYKISSWIAYEASILRWVNIGCFLDCSGIIKIMVATLTSSTHSHFKVLIRRGWDLWSPEKCSDNIEECIINTETSECPPTSPDIVRQAATLTWESKQTEVQMCCLDSSVAPVVLLPTSASSWNVGNKAGQGL